MQGFRVRGVEGFGWLRWTMISQTCHAAEGQAFSTIVIDADLCVVALNVQRLVLIALVRTLRLHP